jgi:hypothetical protein
MAIRSVAMGKLLAETGKISFRASGTCMYPAVRPGDLLHVAPKEIREIAVGEIAVYRKAGRLFGHRAVARGEDSVGPFLVTRPDRAKGGDDGLIRDPDVLGVVRRIERNGREVQARDGVPAGGPTMVPSLVAVLIDGRQAARERILRAFGSVQRTGIYRRIAGPWLVPAASEMEYVVEVPLDGRPGSPFSRELGAREIDSFDLRGNGAPERWTLILRRNLRPAASLSFLRRPPGCPYEGWWLTGAKARIRYRGTGVEERLVGKAREILARSGLEARGWERAPWLAVRTGDPR